MKKVLLTVAAALTGMTMFAAIPAHADAKASFEAAKCTKCHSVEAWGLKAKKPNKAPDLSNIKDLKTADEIVQFVSKKAEKKAIFGKKKGKMIHHKKKFTKPALQEIAKALAGGIK